MWNSKANFLVVITDHVKDSSEGITKNVLEELWLMPGVLNTLFVIPILDTSLSLEDTDYVTVIDTYKWKPQQSRENVHGTCRSRACRPMVLGAGKISQSQSLVRK